MFRRKLLVLLGLAVPLALVSTPAQAFVDKDCADFASQRAAQIFFIKAGGPQRDPHRLDRDGDGVVCESNPEPHYYGTTLPPKHVSSSVSLAFKHAGRIAGETALLTLKASPAAPRVIEVQRQQGDGSWESWTRRTTSSSGVATLSFAAPGASRSYRAVVLSKRVGSVVYDQRVSPARTLTIKEQSVVLTLPAEVERGQSATAVVEASPIRKGRVVSLQRWVDGEWTTFGKKGKENAAGRARFALPTKALGQTEWRAVAARSSGAASAPSAVGVVSIVDTTSPSAPASLSATPTDSAVDLSWTAVSDAASYLVERSSDGGSSWVSAGTTGELSLRDGGLDDATSYQYRVAAVDASGNRSTWTVSASVVPTTPVGSRTR